MSGPWYREARPLAWYLRPPLLRKLPSLGRVVAVINPKGGAGKTTLAMNLAASLVEEGRSVLLLDADPQRSASRWADQRQGEPWFPIVPIGNGEAERFARDLEGLSAAAELTLIDTPPELDGAAALSLRIADLALIPVSPSPLDLWAAADALELVRRIRAERRAGLPRAALVPARQVSTRLARELRERLCELGEPVAAGFAQRTVVAEAVALGRTVVDHAPGSAAHREFRKLAREVLDRLSD